MTFKLANMLKILAAANILSKLANYVDFLLKFTIKMSGDYSKLARMLDIARIPTALFFPARNFKFQTCLDPLSGQSDLSGRTQDRSHDTITVLTHSGQIAIYVQFFLHHCSCDDWL